jgi:transposase-like protein
MLNEMNRCEAPQMLSPYLRRTKSIVELLPCLYLKGISTGDFQEALSSLPGEDALHDTGMAHRREEAERAMATFEESYGAKYPKAVQCLTKDREELLAF